MLAAGASAQGLAVLKNTQKLVSEQARYLSKTLKSGGIIVREAAAVDAAAQSQKIVTTLKRLPSAARPTDADGNPIPAGIDRSSGAAANPSWLEDKTLPFPFKNSAVSENGEKIYFDKVARRLDFSEDGKSFYRYFYKDAELNPRQSAEVREYLVKKELWDRINQTLKRTALTPEQRQRVISNRQKIELIDFSKGGERHFANSVADPVWNEINHNLLYPAAQKHAIFINGQTPDMVANFITSYAGSGKYLITKAEFENIFKTAGNMGDEVLVYALMHGDIDQNGRWYGVLDKTERITMPEILDNVYSLRAAGKVKTVNLFLPSCSGGAAFDEAMAWVSKLPAEERKHINIFTLGGRKQVVYGTLLGPIKAGKTPLVQSIAENVIEGAENGHISPKIYLNGRETDILKEAVNRARALGDIEMADGLAAIEAVTEAGNAQDLRAALQSPAFQNIFTGKEKLNMTGIEKVEKFGFGGLSLNDISGGMFEKRIPKKYSDFVTETAKKIFKTAGAPSNL